MNIHLESEADLHLLVDAYISLSQGVKVAFLYGDLGAGKTTFVKALAKYLGSEDEASSPTYSLVNEYDVSQGKLFHIDLYRLEDEQEALEIGIEDYIYSDHYCMVEWPQVIEQLVDKAVVIKIETNDDQSRSVEIDLVNF